MEPLLAGSVIISRCSGSAVDDTPIHITVDDEISRCRVLEIYMSLEEFAKAITGSYGDAKIEHFPKSPIGMKAENKTEIVPFDSYQDKEKDINAALKPFEVDGWKARRSDMTNGHCRVKNGQRVVFFRHVDPKTDKPVLR